jgi:hypothetical protein
MSTTDTPGRLVARWVCGLLPALLCGCMSAPRAGLPRLYADPGVQVERPSRGVVTYTKGMALQSGDVIQTTDGYAVIDFDRGNVVDLRPNTRIALGSITLFFGELFARVAEVAAHGGGEVVTDELAASVEGTQYAVRRASESGRAGAGSGSTAVIVRDGNVRCAPRGSGTWPAVVVRENFVLHVTGARVSGPPAPIDAAAETQWTEEVERRLLPRRVRGYPGAQYPIFGPRPRLNPPPPPPQRPPRMPTG